jgi:hypothetical protein
LQAVCRPQRMLIQQLRRQISNLIAWKNFSPCLAQQTQTCHRAFFIEIRYLVLATEAANSTMNFYEASPPNCGCKSSQIGLGLVARRFVNT